MGVDFLEVDCRVSSGRLDLLWITQGHRFPSQQYAYLICTRKFVAISQCYQDIIDAFIMLPTDRIEPDFTTLVANIRLSKHTALSQVYFQSEVNCGIFWQFTFKPQYLWSIEVHGQN